MQVARSMLETMQLFRKETGQVEANAYYHPSVHKDELIMIFATVAQEVHCRIGIALGSVVCGVLGRLQVRERVLNAQYRCFNICARYMTEEQIDCSLLPL